MVLYRVQGLGWKGFGVLGVWDLKGLGLKGWFRYLGLYQPITAAAFCC